MRVRTPSPRLCSSARRHFSGGGHGEAAGAVHDFAEAVRAEEQAAEAAGGLDRDGVGEGGLLAVVLGFGIAAAAAGADAAAGGEGGEEGCLAGAVFADEQGERALEGYGDGACGEKGHAGGVAATWLYLEFG